MIGIIGAGQIVEFAHLPAYGKLGLKPVAIYDADSARAHSIADRWNIAVAVSIEAVLENPDVQIVDIAVPPAAQVSIANAALLAGKHVLAQKPLAPTLAEAETLVETAARQDRYLVVNQQMRWSPVVRAITNAVSDGRLGSIRWLTVDLDLPMPAGEFNHWLALEPRFTLLFNTLHLLDTARYLLGEPLSLSAIVDRCDPHLQLTGDTDVMLALEFPQAKCWLTDRRNGCGDLRAEFRAIGENGVLRGRFGLWTNYPIGEDDQIEYKPVGADAKWEQVPVEDRWIPDAFTGPISELARAVNDGTEPTISGSDHLKTLRLVEAAYHAAETGCRVELQHEETPSVAAPKGD